MHLRTAAALLLLLSCRSGGEAAEPPRRPNLILVMADDLGWGDLGSYGQRLVPTPNLDRMAHEGLRFEQFYSGSTVCAPSRCVLMTGLHTGRCEVRGNARMSLSPETVTVAEVLKQAGYATGLVGKWGLGQEGSDGVPTRQGFDSFFGYLDQAHAHNYYPSFLIRDEARVAQPNVVPNEGERGQGVATEKVEYSHDLFTDEALGFVRSRASADAPFFLYLAYTIPHANNEAGKEGMEVPDAAAHGEADWPGARKGFAGMVARLDRDVGRLLDLLAELGVAEDTVVLFTSDNGPHREGGHDPDFFDSNGPFRGIKRDLTEGGIRVPTLAWGPGRVPAGRATGYLGGFQDVLPTFAELAGADEHVPAGLDGRSFAEALRGAEGGAAPHPALYWAFYERGGAQALRDGDWKLVQQPIDSAPRLYDLASDPGESVDLAAAHPARTAELVRRMAEQYEPSERWRFPAGKQAER
ncbi:MAG: arylsulfatase [Planctomycetota bacterium]